MARRHPDPDRPPRRLPRTLARARLATLARRIALVGTCQRPDGDALGSRARQAAILRGHSRARADGRAPGRDLRDRCRGGARPGLDTDSAKRRARHRVRLRHRRRSRGVAATQCGGGRDRRANHRSGSPAPGRGGSGLEPEPISATGPGRRRGRAGSHPSYPRMLRGFVDDRDSRCACCRGRNSAREHPPRLRSRCRRHARDSRPANWRALPGAAPAGRRRRRRR